MPFWPEIYNLVDTEIMKVSPQIDITCIYLVCGIILTAAAIILPAHQVLLELESKRDFIIFDRNDLHYQIEVYQSFLDELDEGNNALQQRIAEMQFNLPPSGTPVVIDRSASQTPLDWVAKRSRRTRALDATPQQSSLLSSIVQGRGRLWLIACGAFLIFVGLIGKTKTT